MMSSYSSADFSSAEDYEYHMFSETELSERVTERRSYRPRGSTGGYSSRGGATGYCSDTELISVRRHSLPPTHRVIYRTFLPRRVVSEIRRPVSAPPGRHRRYVSVARGRGRRGSDVVVGRSGGICGQEAIERRVIGEFMNGTTKTRLVKVQEYAPPHFAEPVQPQVVREGESCVLRARVSGRPPPRVTWSWDREGQRGGVVDTDRVHSHYDGKGECLLILENVTPRDSVNVTCEASNAGGRAACTANVVVVRE